MSVEERSIEFGTEQLNNPTPMFMKYILRVAMFLSGVWALFPQDLIGFSDDNYGQINRWIIVINAVLMFAIKFFGWSDGRK